DLAVVGESSDVQETCALLRERTPAVVLLDLHMGRELSLSALFEIRGASPDTAIVILTMEDDPAFVAPAWNAGAAGYVLKESSRTDLVRAIRTVGKGGRYVDPAIGGVAPSKAQDSAPPDTPHQGHDTHSVDTPPTGQSQPLPHGSRARCGAPSRQRPPRAGAWRPPRVAPTARARTTTQEPAAPHFKCFLCHPALHL